VHRGGAIRVADKVLVMREGQVQAFGPAAEIVPGLAPAPQPAPPPQPVPQPRPAAAPMQTMTMPLRANDEYRLRA
jgi:ATP-binding cassette subfamily C exporter for protease/lipase